MTNLILMKCYRFVLGFLTPFVLIFALLFGGNNLVFGRWIPVSLAVSSLLLLGVFWVLARPSYITALATLLWTLMLFFGGDLNLHGIYGSIVQSAVWLVCIGGLVYNIYTLVAEVLRQRKEQSEIVRRVRERCQRQTSSNEA